MSFHPKRPEFTANAAPGQSPQARRGPEMYQLDPLHEIRDQPRCEIGDLPLSIEDEPVTPTAGYSAR